MSCWAGEVIGAPRGGVGRLLATANRFRASPNATAQSKTMEVRIITYPIKVRGANVRSLQERSSFSLWQSKYIFNCLLA
jgi:hypothetical protein